MNSGAVADRYKMLAPKRCCVFKNFVTAKFVIVHAFFCCYYYTSSLLHRCVFGKDYTVMGQLHFHIIGSFCFKAAMNICSGKRFSSSESTSKMILYRTLASAAVLGVTLHFCRPNVSTPVVQTSNCCRPNVCRPNILWPKRPYTRVVYDNRFEVRW